VFGVAHHYAGGSDGRCGIGHVLVHKWEGSSCQPVPGCELQPGPITTYQWATLAFGTAFTLNLMLLLYERGNPAKAQLAILTCYINLLAGSSCYLSSIGWMPVARDIWGQGIHVGREIMWLYTTVIMVRLGHVVCLWSSNPEACSHRYEGNEKVHLFSFLVK
jgi:hypothetical protein